MAASPFIRLIIMKQISAYSAQIGQLGAHRFNTPLKLKRFNSTRRFKKRAQLCETPGKGVGCCAVFLGPLGKIHKIPLCMLGQLLLFWAKPLLSPK